MVNTAYIVPVTVINDGKMENNHISNYKKREEDEEEEEEDM